MTIKEQTRDTLHEVGIPITTFCKKINLSTAAYYRWQHDDLRLSKVKEDSIRRYINKMKEVIV